MNIDLLVGARHVRVLVSDDGLAEAVRRYYAPALKETPRDPEVVLEVDSDGVRVVSGVPPKRWNVSPPAVQLERALLDLLFALHPEGPVLHAGCVIWQGLPIVFVAPSGSGKSSLSRAAVRTGALYLSDDLVILGLEAAYGFARAIRFSELRAPIDAIPDYLKDTILDGYGRGSERGWHTPIWWQGGEVCRALPLPQERVVVVTLSRGQDAITPLTEVQRLVALHEAAIIKAGEYNGSLGTGPGFHLTWEDPDAAFSLLKEQLSQNLNR